MTQETINLTDLTDRDRTVLQRIYLHEQEVNATKPDYYLGWEWVDVGVAQATINRLITLGVVKRTFSSNRTKAHQLTDEARALLAAGVLGSSVKAPSEEQAETFSTHYMEQASASMFSDIIGYDNLKELLREGLLLPRPIHVVMVGPPALAKTLFLWDIERIWGDRVLWVLGSGASRAGLWDGLAERRPRILLIDEIDKMAAADHAALLSLMEKGRLVRLKVHRRLDIQLTVWVVASANRIQKMAPELLSRFKVYRVLEYTATEFRTVVTNTLVSHEGISENDAAEIASRLVGKSHDVREAIRVARLSRRVGVQRAVELLTE